MNLEQYWEKLPANLKTGFWVWGTLKGEFPTEEEIKIIQKYRPMGFTFFKRNLKNLFQMKELISYLKSFYPEPLKPFFAIDEEGGRVSRLPWPHIRGKSVGELASFNLEEDYRSQLLAQLSLCEKVGINMVFAPVVDILTNPENQVIGDRSFGKDAQTVCHWTQIALEIFQNSTIRPVLKHFPGHGDTFQDSHKECARSLVSFETLWERELLPYRTFLSQVPCVMTSHVSFPSLFGPMPATLNPQISQELLREKLGFQGVLISDDLRMNAISSILGYDKNIESSITENISLSQENSYEYLKEASLLALQSGVDVLLPCKNLEEDLIVFETIEQKIKESHPADFKAKLSHFQHTNFYQ